MPSQARIHIDQRTCKKCAICVAFCPRGVLASGLLNEVQVDKAEACNLCRLCELRCPDFAITVEAG